MRLRPVLSIIGLLICVFSISLLPPILISLEYHDGETLELSGIFLFILCMGAALWFLNYRASARIYRHEGFLIVVLFWVLLGILGSMPLMFSLHISFLDAVFESVSGLTTTGATVLQGLDQMHPSILFYRQEIQWFGGMGLVVLAVAILPVLRIGGMSLYRAEIPGPMKEEKMVPRLASSSRSLWGLYVAITACCALAYWLAGMTPFDALSHSLSTVSTGGFSTHDASLAYFHSPMIEAIAIVFMLLGAINFGVHFSVLQRRSLGPYAEDVEVRWFLGFVVIATALITTGLWYSHYYNGVLADLRNAVFEVVSVITSTGFGTVDFNAWPVVFPVMLIAISFIGGCGGSTAGGMKVLRVLILFRLGYREIIRLVHPRALLLIKLNGRVVPAVTLQSILGFFAVYMVSFALLMLLLMATGMDQVSAYSAVATCINNLGPGMGQVSQSFASVSDPGKVISVVAMLLGRLEIFSVLVLLHPEFWRG
jgi:trk system potassium uptake protein TrkH